MEPGVWQWAALPWQCQAVSQYVTGLGAAGPQAELGSVLSPQAALAAGSNSLRHWPAQPGTVPGSLSTLSISAELSPLQAALGQARSWAAAV